MGDGCRRRHGRSRRWLNRSDRQSPDALTIPVDSDNPSIALSNGRCWSARAIRHGKAIGPCPESVSGGSPPARGDAAACRLALEPHQHGHATHVGAVLYPPASASPRAGSRSRRLRLFRSAIGESAVRARLSACLARVVRRVSARFASRWWSLPLPLWAMFGSEGAACRRVDALVAVVPPDAISRRRVPSQHLFNDTRAGSAVG